METWVIVLICVGLFVFAMGLLYVSATLVKTPEGHVSIISKRATGPYKTIGPIYNFKMIWPFEFVSAKADMAKRTNNIAPFKVQALKTLNTKVIVYLMTKEISLDWQLGFKIIEHKQALLDMLKNYFDLKTFASLKPVDNPDLQDYLDERGLILPTGEFNMAEFKKLCGEEGKVKLESYFQLAKNGEFDEAKVLEMLKDIVQSAFRGKAANKAMVDVISAQNDIIDEIKNKLSLECERRDLPIKINELTMQDTMEILNKDLEKALESQAIIETKKDAAVEQEKLDIFEANKKKKLDLIEANKQIKIAELKAKKDGITFNAMKKHLGIDKLEPNQIADHFLSRDAMEVMAEMAKSPNKVFFFNGNDNILAQIMAMVQSASAPANTGGKKS